MTPVTRTWVRTPLRRPRTTTSLQRRETVAQALNGSARRLLMVTTPSRHSAVNRNRHAANTAAMRVCVVARHMRDPSRCRAKPPCRLALRGTACHPFYLALCLRPSHPLPAPTHRQPHTGCAAQPGRLRGCSKCCTLAPDCLHVGTQSGYVADAASAHARTQFGRRIDEKPQQTGSHERPRPHGALQVHSGDATPITADAVIGPK